VSRLRLHPEKSPRRPHWVVENSGPRRQRWDCLDGKLDRRRCRSVRDAARCLDRGCRWTGGWRHVDGRRRVCVRKLSIRHRRFRRFRQQPILDSFGNTVRRFVAPPGDLTITSDAVIEDSGLPDPVKLDAGESPLEQLPNETLVFLLGSRSKTDKLADIAWRHFGSSPRGWRRVQAICDFVCGHLDLRLRTRPCDPRRF